MDDPHLSANRRSFATWPLLAASAVVAVILAVTMLKRARTDGEASATVPTADLRSRAGASSPATSAKPAPPAFSPAERHSRRRALQAEQVRKGRESHQALASRYAAEPVNAAWAGAKEARLLAASVSDEIRRVGAVPQNFRASCRSTTCKVDADFANRGSMEDWLTLFATGSGGELPFVAYVVTPNADGSYHLDVVGLAKR
jgi:hypothetical protein